MSRRIFLGAGLALPLLLTARSALTSEPVCLWSMVEEIQGYVAHHPGLWIETSEVQGGLLLITKWEDPEKGSKVWCVPLNAINFQGYSPEQQVTLQGVFKDCKKRSRLGAAIITPALHKRSYLQNQGKLPMDTPREAELIRRTWARLEDLRLRSYTPAQKPL